MSDNTVIKVSMDILEEFLRSHDDTCWKLDSTEPSISHYSPVSTDTVVDEIERCHGLDFYDYLLILSDTEAIEGVDDTRYPVANKPDELQNYCINNSGRDYLYVALTPEDLSNLNYINIMMFFEDECE